MCVNGDYLDVQLDTPVTTAVQPGRPWPISTVTAARN
jgi:hypothetical protein